jgi:hypothetical protein
LVAFAAIGLVAVLTAAFTRASTASNAITTRHRGRHLQTWCHGGAGACGGPGEAGASGATSGPGEGSSPL